MTEQSAQPRTRRALLAGLAGAAGAWAASAVARVSPVAAANGGSVIIGSANSATLTTSHATSSGTGFTAISPTIGVQGNATGTATTAAGVLGTANNNGSYGVYAEGKLGTTGPLEFVSVEGWSNGNSKQTLDAAPTDTVYLYVRASSTGGSQLVARRGTTDVVIRSV